ncbi:uncharacterized protein PHALS_11113 [Plasmopara halstedii]|uniref:RxLR-like protein n=1 Tax=Plasmopara halstedii TaxID=4781 RepID=A0A0N7L5A6_PLAHL|nr:uncharacterized protein PHALS_11113 [Plasmopara halstedii]CEG40939.1 hypothetical protein PHALS_11113 [Plasmopara halstedii]|eukprot:XP_024577308.1 hypothetical protein PHALS_11113 [Plasmopara halstedii]
MSIWNYRAMPLSLSGVVTALMVLATLSQAIVQNDYFQQHRILGNSANWPSLLFEFHVKRSDMGIYGQTNFSVIANPVIMDEETRVLYDVFATFRTNKLHYNYTQVNGAMYLTTTKVNSKTTSTQCLQSEFNDFPPINAIIAAINIAKPLSINFSRCSNGRLFKVTVDSIHFALCVSNNHGFIMYGHDLDILVTFQENQVNIVTPTSDHDCDTEVMPSLISFIGRLLLTGTLLPPQEMRDLKDTLSFSLLDSDNESCTCKSTPRPCIFVHGLGVKFEAPGLLDSMKYWGNSIAHHAPCCTSIKYAHLNTVNYTWTNATQQQKVCDRALAVSNSSTDFTIKDTIVVTHSMGSLIFAGAIAHKRCELDPSSTWVSTAAPMMGSMASDFAQKVCTEDTGLLTEKLADYNDQCPVNEAIKSLAYQNGSYSTEKLNAEYAAAQEVYRSNVFAVMCSESYSGIMSSYQAKFWVLGELVPHKTSKNDGTVEFHSCAKGLNVSDFRDTYKSRFYRTELNHYDMQFHSEDAFWNQAKMPLKCDDELMSVSLERSHDCLPWIVPSRTSCTFESIGWKLAMNDRKCFDVVTAASKNW